MDTRNITIEIMNGTGLICMHINIFIANVKYNQLMSDNTSTPNDF